MAHATRNTRTEKRMVETEVEVNDGVVLMLTDDEAIALAYLTGSIGGISEFRNLVSRVYRALKDAGVNSQPMWRGNSWPIADASGVEFIRPPDA